MNRYDNLMQAVLDGVATPEQVRDVEARMAADPAARERFEELRAVFDGLRSVPKVFPPEGLVASVLAALPAEGRSASDNDQLFDESGVIGASSGNDRNDRGRRSRGSERGFRVFQPWFFSRDTAMNARKNGMSANRKIMIGGGLAIAAAAVAVSLGVFPPNSSETAGTIVPAQRYRATQSGDLQGNGSPGTTQPAGPQSAPSAAGLAGTSGTAGLSGTSGLSGTAGTSGLSGTAGTSGLSGTAGTSGLSGTAGTSGLSGTAGTSGLSGTAGTSGLSGTAGTAANTGASQ